MGITQAEFDQLRQQVQGMSGQVQDILADVTEIRNTLSGLADLPNLTLTDANGNSVTVACMLCMLCGIAAGP
jgi:hypothetical protein